MKLISVQSRVFDSVEFECYNSIDVCQFEEEGATWHIIFELMKQTNDVKAIIYGSLYEIVK